MELIIKLLSGETRSVPITPTTTIGELKRTIAQMYSTSTSRLKLSVTNGRVIQLDHDQKTVSDYGLKSGSTVMLLISATSMPFQVFVKNEDGQIKTYEVTDDETVAQLMEKIFEEEGVPVDQQRLIFNGQQLQSGWKLQNYNITPQDNSGSTVILLFKAFQVLVKNEKGQTKTYEVTDDETVAQLMEKIFEEEGVPVDQQRLIFSGRQLESNMRLQDYKITSKSTIFMTLRLRGG